MNSVKILGITMVLCFGLTGCGAVTTQFTRSSNTGILPEKPDDCLIETIRPGEKPKREYSVIGDVFVGGGDAINPRLSGCMNLGAALQQARQVACKNGGDAIILITVDSGGGCASVLGQVVAYR